MSEQSDLVQTAKGAAVLAACIVQTMDEFDSTFQDRFLARLAEAYREVRDDSAVDPGLALQVLAYTRELLTGFSQLSGQREAFLSGYSGEPVVPK